MKEAPTPFAFDVTNLPKTVEQQTLAAVERIERMIADYIAAVNSAKVASHNPKPIQGTKKR